MKKILILLSLSILFVSCGNKEQEKINLDKNDKKMIENVLDVSNTGAKEIEPKTEEQAKKEIDKTEKKDKSITKEKDKTEVKLETKTGTKIESEDKNKKETEITPEEEKEANKLLDELLGGEGDVNSVLDDISK